MAHLRNRCGCFSGPLWLNERTSVALWPEFTIRKDFDELYRAMHGQPLREMDKVIYTVCTLCRDHERSGFVDGIKIGIRLSDELPIA